MPSKNWRMFWYSLALYRESSSHRYFLLSETQVKILLQYDPLDHTGLCDIQDAELIEKWNKSTHLITQTGVVNWESSNDFTESVMGIRVAIRKQIEKCSPMIQTGKMVSDSERNHVTTSGPSCFYVCISSCSANNDALTYQWHAVTLVLLVLQTPVSQWYFFATSYRFNSSQLLYQHWRALITLVSYWD